MCVRRSMNQNQWREEYGCPLYRNPKVYPYKCFRLHQQCDLPTSVTSPTLRYTIDCRLSMSPCPWAWIPRYTIIPSMIGPLKMEWLSEHKETSGLHESDWTFQQQTNNTFQQCRRLHVLCFSIFLQVLRISCQYHCLSRTFKEQSLQRVEQLRGIRTVVCTTSPLTINCWMWTMNITMPQKFGCLNPGKLGPQDPVASFRLCLKTWYILGIKTEPQSSPYQFNLITWHFNVPDM